MQIERDGWSRLDGSGKRDAEREVSGRSGSVVTSFLCLKSCFRSMSASRALTACS